MRCSSLLCSLLVLLLAGPISAWTLWESPYGNTEVVDQQQGKDDVGYSMGGEPGVGQTFILRATPLVRMDFKVKNRTDPRPGRFRLWKWTKDLAATRAQAPVFEDIVDLTGRDTFQQRSFFPDLEVEVGAVYYCEFSRPTGEAYYLAGNKGDTDLYPGGQLWLNGFPRGNKDLWFRTSSSPHGLPQTPVLQPSDPALPWTIPAVPGPPVTRADYQDYLKGVADSVRTRSLVGDNKYSHTWSVYDAMLYRTTNDEQYAKNVALMLRNAAKWRAAHPDEEIGFTWMECPGTAYMCVRNSPSLTADDHAMIRTLLLDSARKHWKIREYGAMNRSLGSAVSYLLVTKLFPDAPEAKEWATYAEGVWNEFWAVRDTDEDSGHYNYLGWRYILEYAMIAGKDDQVWPDARYRALVDRFFQHFSPLGVDAGYGDALGWAVEWPTAVWLFEKAGKQWHAPQYRWLAYRIFDYHRTHLRDEKPWLATYQDAITFGFVYYDTDDKLTPAPPTPPEEILAAKQDGEDASWSPRKTAALGQTFTPTATPLVKLEVKAKNNGNPKPGTVKLWKWQGDYATTVAKPPLYQDVLDLRGKDEYQLKTFFPFLEVEVGAIYYLQFDGAGTAFVLAGTKQAGENGTVSYQGEKQTGSLWYRTYTLSKTGSTVTMRQQGILQTTEQRRADQGRWFKFGEGQVPEKLILRSGYGVDDLHATFDLLSGYGHGHVSIGALSSLTDHGAVIMHENDYRDDAQDQDENMAVLKRYAGGSYGLPSYHCTVSHFSDYRRATVAWLDWTDPHGWQVKQQRRVYFVKNRFLLIRDRFTFSTAMKAAAGQVWHGADVHPTHDANWFDLYWREPRGLAWKFSNPERYALLYFVPRADCDFQAWKERAYSPKYTSPPFVFTQKWVGDADPDTTRWFDSLLLPHGKELSPLQAAGQITILYDDGANVALQIRCGDETWTVVDNPAGKRLTNAKLDTDAHYLLTRSKPNTPDYVLARQASVVKVGAMSLKWPAPVSVEVGAVSSKL
ncbi:MAG: hypothetical protein ACYDBB_18760 [Armatimonadota bacterium]